MKILYFLDKTNFIDFKFKKSFKYLAKDIKSNEIDKINNIYIRPLLPTILMDTIRLQLDKNMLKKHNKLN